MYSFLTVALLKNELRRRNASISGKKADLIERLEAYDRNQNFGADYETQEEDNYQSPDTTKFKDINADSPLPRITKQEIQDYFERYNVKLKWEELYESRHLITARFCAGKENSEYTYIRGECKASIKKNSYIVEAKLSHFLTKKLFIEESHCECAAGSGVHACCKHVAVLLYGVHDIVQNKIIKLHQSCTQQLMTFNRPRKVFYHSPITAQNLPHKRPKCINYNPLNEEDIMENYTNYVSNLAVGYGPSSMPILQTIPPANPHSIEWDHYPCLQKSPQEELLEKLMLKNVEKSQVQEVERNTRGQTATPEWHERRACRITASMFYSICHSQYNKTHLQKILAPRTLRTRAVTHGKVHEPIAIKKYEEDFGIQVLRCGLFISQEFPFLAASPDGLIGEDTVLEVKCPYTPRNCLINEVTVPYLVKHDGVLSLSKSHPYYAQIQGQLYCTGRQYCNFIVYTFKEMKIFFINRDEAYINEMLIHLINFYVHHLEPAIMNKHVPI